VNEGVNTKMGTQGHASLDKPLPVLSLSYGYPELGSIDLTKPRKVLRDTSIFGFGITHWSYEMYVSDAIGKDSVDGLRIVDVGTDQTALVLRPKVGRTHVYIHLCIPHRINQVNIFKLTKCLFSSFSKDQYRF
jgi:hypothetical protein